MDENPDAIYTAIALVLTYGFPVLLAVGAFITGSILERRHFRSIREREAQTGRFPAVPTPQWDPAVPVAEAYLVTSSVVVSLDYFKRLLASLRNVFGGRVQSYESLLDRGKREAILRLKERAPGAHLIVNLRIITSNISDVQSGRNSGGIGGVEVFASGTAIRYTREPDSPAPLPPPIPAMPS